MRTEVLCISVFRVASELRVKLASCKSALNPPVVFSTDRSKAVVPVLVLPFVALWCKSAFNHLVVCSTDRSKAVVPVLVLLFVALWFCSTRLFVVCLSVCHFVLVFFSSFSIVIISLGEERANLNAFRTFVRFVLI